MMLRSAMADIARDMHAFGAAFQNVPRNQFSVAYFDSRREGPGAVDAVLFAKPVDLTKAQILSVLWARNLMFSEETDYENVKSLDYLWNHDTDGPWIFEEFGRFVSVGLFSSIKPAKGRRKLKEHMDHVHYHGPRAIVPPDTPPPEICFGHITSPDDFKDHLINCNILRFYEITTNWNDMSYFFETDRDFGYFSWGTSV